MSSFTPSVSPFHPTEGLGQGVISDISQQQTRSLRPTPIHILDDDSVLQIFCLYRSAVAAIKHRKFDNVGISMMMERTPGRENWWYKPAHVCRRWRNLILESATFLGLHLVCTFGTPVADMLAYSPPLPLSIDYLGEDDHNTTAEDNERIFLALQQPSRIGSIRIASARRNLQRFLMAIDHELPILECLVMLATNRKDGDTLVFPETIQAPHLRYFTLIHVAPPIGSRLLTTALGIVTLCLCMNNSSPQSNPSSLLQWISSLPQLEALMIITFPNVAGETHLSHTPTITHITLPNLCLLSFHGVIADIEVLVRQIDTPRIERLDIGFFENIQVTPVVSIPRLVRFMDKRECKKLRFDTAKFEFSDEQHRVLIHPHGENTRRSFSLCVNCLMWPFNRRISLLSQLVEALDQVFSAVEHLVLDRAPADDGRLSEEDYDIEIERTEWHNLFRPFSKVKNLCVTHGLVDAFSRYLQMDDGELPPDIFPELQELTYFGSKDPGDAFASFIDARRKAGHFVSFKSVHRSPSPSRSSSTEAHSITSANDEDGNE